MTGQKENWGSRMGVVLAVAGSAVGLGNFLRFPGQAVNNGGGAFMIPYLVSFLVLGIPIAWCEWTMGRLGGRYGQNSAPGIMYALWRRAPAKAVGAVTLLIPIVVYMYYVLLEAWCLDYAIEFASGGFAELFAGATAGVPEGGDAAAAVVGATTGHFVENLGLAEHGTNFEHGRLALIIAFCFVVNFFLIYRGVTRGIETFCKFAMPALIVCALIILGRVLTLDDIEVGLGFMWNPDWQALRDPQVWLAASGQIFFSLSVGFGLILCYSSYLRANDDVVLTSLSASSTNEFAEVILGGLIVVPTAFLFLGAEAASQSTFGLGFVTVPAIMNFMPGGSFFGALWFGLLFLAAVTSSLSMLQPAIAFLEDGFGLRRHASVTILGVITLLGALPILYFSRGAVALDHTDFWCNLLMIVAATAQVLVFGWVIGAERGVREANRGADFPIPRFMPFVIRFVTPTFLLAVLGLWTYTNLPDYWERMDAEHQGALAEHGAYAAAATEHFAEAAPQGDVEERVVALVGTAEAPALPEPLPGWLAAARPDAEAAGSAAREDANVARGVFLGILAFLGVLFLAGHLACTRRIGRTIAEAEARGVRLEGDA